MPSFLETTSRMTGFQSLVRVTLTGEATSTKRKPASVVLVLLSLQRFLLFTLFSGLMLSRLVVRGQGDNIDSIEDLEKRPHIKVGTRFVGLRGWKLHCLSMSRLNFKNNSSIKINA